jgi:NhaP-type Na+/H+ and K+/H+ antiporter
LTLALALILFDGGLRTRYQTIRPVLAPSLVLATIGVVVTAAVTVRLGGLKVRVREVSEGVVSVGLIIEPPDPEGPLD